MRLSRRSLPALFTVSSLALYSLGLSSLALCGCDEDPAPSDAGPGADGAGLDDDAGATLDDGGARDAGPTTDEDGGAPTTVTALAPAEGAEVLYSAAIRAAAPPGSAVVEVREASSGAACDAPAPWFECLLDLSGAAPGPLEVTLTARSESGDELVAGTLSLTRRATDAPCTGDGNALNACIVARAMAGDSAGFDGVTYINGDDAHARVRTDTMTGIDARVIERPELPLPTDVVLGLMNESRAYTGSGSCSLMRCFPSSRQRIAQAAYEANMLYMVPEHRDVGVRDFYQWQAPFFLLSQGSSSSERDEIAKGLRALAVMTTEARQAAVDADAVGPLLSFLIVRARQESDAAYLTPEAHPTALPNSPSAERILELAAALRATELPPVARVAAVDVSFPAQWPMRQTLTIPYAIGYSPQPAPDPAPAGEAAIEISLEASTDPAARPLMYFPVVLRAAGAEVALERLDASGARWTVRADFPEDEVLMTGGQPRTVSRVTVGFFPHNGVWLGAPAMVSIGARVHDERATNTNNLD